MKSKEPIKLRGHHLKSIFNIRIELSPQTEKDIELVKLLEKVLREDDKKVIIITGQPDFLCESCSKKRDECFGDHTYDKVVAAEYHLEIGQKYTVKEIVGAVDNFISKYNPTDLALACALATFLN